MPPQRPTKSHFLGSPQKTLDSRAHRTDHVQSQGPPRLDERVDSCLCLEADWRRPRVPGWQHRAVCACSSDSTSRSRRCTRAELARRMGTSGTELARLERGLADPRLSTVARYLAIVGGGSADPMKPCRLPRPGSQRGSLDSRCRAAGMPGSSAGASRARAAQGDIWKSSGMVRCGAYSSEFASGVGWIRIFNWC